LSLDITETVYVKAREGNTAALDELKKLRVRFSIDDFGTGYSSLLPQKSTGRCPEDRQVVHLGFWRGCRRHGYRANDR
jgi:EAL domain-containing protein (putative c-di-GMP-specific phosphodiesterase class I)